DDRLLVAEFVAEDTGEAAVGALGHPRRVHGGGALALVVVNEKVLRLDHLPVEVLVLDLVLTEVALRAQGVRGERRRQCGDGKPGPTDAHTPAPSRSIATVFASLHSRSSW